MLCSFSTDMLCSSSTFDSYTHTYFQCDFHIAVSMETSVPVQKTYWILSPKGPTTVLSALAKTNSLLHELKYNIFIPNWLFLTIEQFEREDMTGISHISSIRLGFQCSLHHYFMQISSEVSAQRGVSTAHLGCEHCRLLCTWVRFSSQKSKITSSR